MSPKLVSSKIRKVPETETLPEALTVNALLIFNAEERYKTVPVALVNVRLVKMPLVEVSVVPEALVKVNPVANRFVLVA